MTEVSLVLPEIGKPDKTQDPRINTAFTAIQTWANGNVDSSNLKAEGVENSRLAAGAVVKSGVGELGTSGVLKNEHVALPSTVKTAAVLTGQVLLAVLIALLEPSENTASAVMTLAAAEQTNTTCQAQSAALAPGLLGGFVAVKRLTGLAGEQTLGANVYATSAKGKAQGFICYLILNG